MLSPGCCATFKQPYTMYGTERIVEKQFFFFNITHYDKNSRLCNNLDFRWNKFPRSDYIPSQ